MTVRIITTKKKLETSYADRLRKLIEKKNLNHLLEVKKDHDFDILLSRAGFQACSFFGIRLDCHGQQIYVTPNEVIKFLEEQKNKE